MKILKAALIFMALSSTASASEEGLIYVKACLEGECETAEFDINELVNPDKYTKKGNLKAKKKSKYPGLSNAPAKVIDGITAAADAMSHLDTIDVAVAYLGNTYHYSYNGKTGGWSFRKIPNSECTLKCRPRLPDSGDSQN